MLHDVDSESEWGVFDLSQPDKNDIYIINRGVRKSQDEKKLMKNLRRRLIRK